MDNQSVGEFNQ